MSIFDAFMDNKLISDSLKQSTTFCPHTVTPLASSPSYLELLWSRFGRSRLFRPPRSGHLQRSRHVYELVRTLGVKGELDEVGSKG